jgi:hypothetical protein
MDLEHLNKSQIILLTLLVSFVTSIATGIVTVFLLAQAPPAVTQTINRIVERTIEQAVPTVGGTKETTVVVKEDDLVADSISKASGSFVRIRKTVTLDSGDTADRTVGLGVLLTKDGLFATDAAIFDGESTYTAALPDGSVYGVKVSSLGASYATALAMLVPEKGKTITVAPAKLGDVKSVRLGQTVLAFSGTQSQSVSTGIVGNITTAEIASSTVVTAIGTSVPDSVILPGSPLINIFGEVIGISTYDSRRKDASAFTPTTDLPAQMQTKQKAADAAPAPSAAAAQSAAVGNSSQ